jgi:membrane protein DedA with SNARE-associated domain
MESLARVIGDLSGPVAYLILFASTALEASALVGLFVPGEAALLLGGFLAYQGRLSLWLVMVVAVLGAVIGDSIGYEIGRHLGGRIHDGRLGRLVGRDRWNRARKSLRRHGGKAVFLGRFVGLLRALVPAVAGDSGMRYPRFLAWNVAGGVVWAPLVVLAGYLAGPSYHVVERWLGRGSLVLAAVVVAAFIGWHVAKKVREHRRQPA